MDLTTYYDERLSEYEKIYLRPERSIDLEQLSKMLSVDVAGKRVLELACGTGYWTSIASLTASQLCATDLSEKALAVVSRKKFSCPIIFQKSDALAPSIDLGHYDIVMAMFWWSHIPQSKLTSFLQAIISFLESDGGVVFADNRFVAGSSTPISRIDSAGNTYQIRQLANGKKFEVLKNFPAEKDIELEVSKFFNVVEIINCHHYWYAVGRGVKS